MQKVHLKSFLREIDQCILLFLTFCLIPISYLYEKLFAWSQSQSQSRARFCKTAGSRARVELGLKFDHLQNPA